MESSGLEKSGWVLKKAQVMPTWNSRFVIADPTNLRLKYYKERPKTGSEKLRGELKVTDCTVSVDASCNENEYRFLITTANQKETYHLEVDDDWERQEWIRVIRLISDLGVTKQQIIEEQKLQDNFRTFQLSCEQLLKQLETTSTESRNSLDRIAKQKWKSKCRLIELRDKTEQKHRALRDRQNEMKTKEKTYREELSHLNQQLYLLQQDVRKSNELQQQIVEIFGGTSIETNSSNENNNSSSNTRQLNILEKAHKAITLCQSRLHNNYPKQPLIKQKSAPNETNHESNNNSNSNTNTNNVTSEDEKTSNDSIFNQKIVFENEMINIIKSQFPNVIPNSNTNTNNNTNIDYSDENENIIRIFELYHRYYVEIHAPREMELIKIRTKCEQKYNSLRYVSTKKELARREEDEIEWIMMEMKRAIDRLNREGVPLAPNEEKESMSNHSNKNVKKNKNTKKNVPKTKSLKNVSSNQNDKHRNSSDIVPVLAHRSTWSEASDTIFQLNVARQQQYQATRDLEEALKSREVVRSWYEDKIATIPKTKIKN